jgi:hypothetical protein
MVCYPALYLCRHSLEPYLKDALPRCPKPSRKSMPLVDDFSVRFFVISSTQISPNFREMISMPRQISIRWTEL